MKKNIKTILLILGSLAVIGIAIFGITKYAKYREEKAAEEAAAQLQQNLATLSWVRENVALDLNKAFGDNVYSVTKDEAILPYNENYRVVIDDLLAELTESTYAFDEPLIIYNPYGTNNLAANMYFETEVATAVSYTVSVEDSNIPDYSQTLNSDSETGYTTDHKYQVIGLVPGCENTVALTATAEDGTTEEYSYTIDMSSVSCESDTVLESVSGESTAELTEGLFVLFGLDKAFNANNYIYDNNGVLRADLVINDYRSDRIISIDGKLYYSTDVDEFAVIDRLGRIEKLYSIEGYIMHHDYVYDEANNQFLILVNSAEEEDSTIEDLIISLDLETGEVKEVVDMKDLLPEIYEAAKMPESGKNTYGGTGLDWIHLNSLSLVNDNGDIVISGREISTVIYLENIYEKPAVKYMITDEAVFADTIYSDLVLEKVGDFVNQAGQHTITYVPDDTLPEGQYYLLMYNNNYGSSVTKEDFPWDEYPGVGTFAEGDASQYYKYLVDENAGTYELVETFDVAYSSIVSSVQDVEDNHVTSSGKSNCYAEYDENGILIRQFNYTSQKYAYRAFKYDFNGIWFQ